MSVAHGFDEALGGEVLHKVLGVDTDDGSCVLIHAFRDELRLDDDVLLELRRLLHLERTLVLSRCLGLRGSHGLGLVPPSHSRRRVLAAGGPQWAATWTRHMITRRR